MSPLQFCGIEPSEIPTLKNQRLLRLYENIKGEFTCPLTRPAATGLYLVIHAELMRRLDEWARMFAPACLDLIPSIDQQEETK